MSGDGFCWEEIQGFKSRREYKQFEAHLQGLVTRGVVEEIPPDPSYGPGLVFGGRWFKHKKTGAVWRLIEAEYRFSGAWEPVRRH